MLVFTFLSPAYILLSADAYRKACATSHKHVAETTGCLQEYCIGRTAHIQQSIHCTLCLAQVCLSNRAIMICWVHQRVTCPFMLCYPAIWLDQLNTPSRVELSSAPGGEQLLHGQPALSMKPCMLPSGQTARRPAAEMSAAAPPPQAPEQAAGAARPPRGAPPAAARPQSNQTPGCSAAPHQHIQQSVGTIILCTRAKVCSWAYTCHPTQASR